MTERVYVRRDLPYLLVRQRRTALGRHGRRELLGRGHAAGDDLLQGRIAAIHVQPLAIIQRRGEAAALAGLAVAGEAVAGGRENGLAGCDVGGGGAGRRRTCRSATCLTTRLPAGRRGLADRGLARSAAAS